MWLKLAAISEYLALAGIWIAVGCSVYLALHSPVRSDRTYSHHLRGVRVAAREARHLGLDVCRGPDRFALLIMLALISLRERRPVYVAPILLMLPESHSNTKRNSSQRRALCCSRYKR